MADNLKPGNIDQLLAEADELVRQINSGFIKEMKEEHRLQFGEHLQNLEKIKSSIQGKAGKKETQEADSGAEGIHEAIQDIVKAIKDLKKYLL
jgi:hypothetical protein